MAVTIPQPLVDRAHALGFRFVTIKIVNFAHPKGEDVTHLITPWSGEAVFNITTLESFIAGCESADEESA